VTTQRSFKRLVRTRMEKTGESYTAARAVLLAADAAEAERMKAFWRERLGALKAQLGVTVGP
jgi:hypothetical protein